MLRTFAYPTSPVIVRACLLVILASVPLALLKKANQVEPVIGETAPVAQEEASFVELPDFDAITDIGVKKQAFFAFFHQYIHTENTRILENREKLLVYADVLASDSSLSQPEAETLWGIAADYRLADSEMSMRDLVDELLVRVDIIPISLALAQAANESAWGTSRFAREGNNIFGQWCFDEGCGLIPGRRARDASHEVRAFASVEASVRAYYRNLNTNPAYAYLRELRAQMRYKDLPLDPKVLAEGLMRYSERGRVYVAELQDIMRINDLQDRDQQS
jgi:Bax protein